MAKRSRNLLVWLHVVTSVGWMSQALALFALLVVGMSSGDEGAFRMAHELDHRVLAMMANTSAFTGMMLSALTPWGVFRHWWVLGKFVLTIGQLYAGIFLLSDALGAAADGAGVSPALPAATLLMASVLAFQAWLSVAKPWGRTPWSPKAKPRNGSPWMLVVATVVPVADFALGTFVFGNPTPALSLLVVVGYSIRRATAATVPA